MKVIEIRCGNLFLKEWNNKLYLIVHQSYSHLAPVFCDISENWSKMRI